MTPSFTEPCLVRFPRIGESAIGFISVMESGVHLPFEVKRVFWTYYTPESVVRGRHAHHRTQQVLVAIAGRVIVTTEDPMGRIQTFALESPDTGVFIPKYVWHTMQYTHSAVQVVFASHQYDESDYIRDYDEFRRIAAQKIK